jgi:hypothetical protein
MTPAMKQAADALRLIAGFHDRTLLGPMDRGDEFCRGHELGASKAFSQASDVAAEALRALEAEAAQAPDDDWKIAFDISGGITPKEREIALQRLVIRWTGDEAGQVPEERETKT